MNKTEHVEDKRRRRRPKIFFIPSRWKMSVRNRVRFCSFSWSIHSLPKPLRPSGWLSRTGWVSTEWIQGEKSEVCHITQELTENLWQQVSWSDESEFEISSSKHHRRIQRGLRQRYSECLQPSVIHCRGLGLHFRQWCWGCCQSWWN